MKKKLLYIVNPISGTQRRLSRMQGSKKHEDKSNNYIKQLRKVNKIHRHIANQRLDNLHKISTEIANQYDVVCVESLNMRSMSNKGFGNGKATLDNGYGMFLSMLEYKLSDRNKYLVKVDKWYPSSQICHCQRPERRPHQGAAQCHQRNEIDGNLGWSKNHQQSTCYRQERTELQCHCLTDVLRNTRR